MALRLIQGGVPQRDPFGIKSEKLKGKSTRHLSCKAGARFAGELGTWNSELGTWNVERGTRNSELGTWNVELGTRNSELGTRNSELVYSGTAN